MTRRKPFTNADIAERSTWPETKAALRGPDSYDELGILNPTQRRELVTLAHVAPDREKLFVRVEFSDYENHQSLPIVDLDGALGALFRVDYVPQLGRGGHPHAPDAELRRNHAGSSST